jgi:CheY-like chemotaxis protein
VRQVLVNLVANAVKFTADGGHVVVDATRTGSFTRVTVRDDGIGIPESARDRLFREFTQVDGTITRRFGGTGLGLAISKKLVELQGGTIDYESKLGEGSTFFFTLPSADAPVSQARPTPPTATVPTTRGKKILAVDDNEANLRLLKALLLPKGYDVVEAQDADSALRLAREQHPDLVLMDVMLPDVDGLCVTRSLHDDPSTKDIPVVAVTAKAMRDDEARALEAGCVAYVTKPIEPRTLWSVVENALRGAA